jgi:hypothetical protein
VVSSSFLACSPRPARTPRPINWEAEPSPRPYCRASPALAFPTTPCCRAYLHRAHLPRLAPSHAQQSTAVTLPRVTPCSHPSLHHAPHAVANARGSRVAARPCAQAVPQCCTPCLRSPALHRPLSTAPQCLPGRHRPLAPLNRATLPPEGHEPNRCLFFQLRFLPPRCITRNPLIVLFLFPQIPNPLVP